MHLPTRAFVSESQRELFVAGLGSEFEDRGGVVERHRRRGDWGIRGVLSEEKIEGRSRIFILAIDGKFGEQLDVSREYRKGRFEC
jgi:hypothetical protein